MFHDKSDLTNLPVVCLSHSYFEIEMKSLSLKNARQIFEEIRESGLLRI